MPSPLPTVSSARDIMSSRLVTLRPEMDVFQGIEVLVKNKISGAPVVDENRNLLGIFSEKSCMKVLIDAAYEGLPTNSVSSFMDHEPTTIEPDTQLLTIAQIFLSTPRRRLPVLEDGKLVGQVSRRDVIRAASKIMQLTKDNKKVLLYLSALRDMQDAPAV